MGEREVGDRRDRRVGSHRRRPPTDRPRALLPLEVVRCPEGPSCVRQRACSESTRAARGTEEQDRLRSPRCAPPTPDRTRRHRCGSPKRDSAHQTRRAFSASGRTYTPRSPVARTTPFAATVKASTSRKVTCSSGNEERRSTKSGHSRGKLTGDQHEERAQASNPGCTLGSGGRRAPRPTRRRPASSALGHGNCDALRTL